MQHAIMFLTLNFNLLSFYTIAYLDSAPKLKKLTYLLVFDALVRVVGELTHRRKISGGDISEGQERKCQFIVLPRRIRATQSQTQIGRYNIQSLKNTRLCRSVVKRTIYYIHTNIELFVKSDTYTTLLLLYVQCVKRGNFPISYKLYDSRRLSKLSSFCRKILLFSFVRAFKRENFISYTCACACRQRRAGMKYYKLFNSGDVRFFIKKTYIPVIGFDFASLKLNHTTTHTRDIIVYRNTSRETNIIILRKCIIQNARKMRRDRKSSVSQQP